MYMFKKLIDLAGLEVPGCLLSAAEQWKKEEVAAQLKKRETRVVNPSKLSAKDVYQLFAGQKSKSALNSRRRVLFAILSERQLWTGTLSPTTPPVFWWLTGSLRT